MDVKIERVRRLVGATRPFFCAFAALLRPGRAGCELPRKIAAATPPRVFMRLLLACLCPANWDIRPCS